MHEGAANVLQGVLEKHCRALKDEIGPLLEQSVRSASESASSKTAEALNQCLRRIRQAPSQAEVLNVLRGAAGELAAVSVVLAVERSQEPARMRIAGTEETLSLEDAPALSAVFDTKDPVVTLPTPGELGLAVSALLGSTDRKAYLYPVTVRHEVTAMLIVSGGVAPASSEFLCEAAGLKLEALTSPPAPPAAGLVHIAPQDVPASETSGPRSWNDLPAEDQRLHLQAQRVARVRVAQMRLDHGDALRRGTFQGDLYGALRGEIDAARAEFLQAFLAKSATMVDYLHLEIMRSLAHDDDRLLGKEYPGPMV